MRGMMDPLVQLSPFGGELVPERVAGATSGRLNPENDVDVSVGHDRTMFAYVPRSGCPHPKQTPVLMVLRDDATRESALGLLRTLGLDALSEDRHFVVLFPNPCEGGWNHGCDETRDDDRDFLVRCFAALPHSTGGVAGFNGMIFHLATTPASSAMALALALTRPLDAAAVMLGAPPEGASLPKGVDARQVAWLYERDRGIEGLLASVNAPTCEDEPVFGVTRHVPATGTGACHYVSGRGLDARELADAWELMFSGTRRWRNDSWGSYQPRVDFSGLGFVAHVGDAGLPLADGLPRTWYEYVPEAVARTRDPAPLVIYCHGINCVGLYGAEQSLWHQIAREDGLMCVFPDATIESRWNMWDDPRLPSDMGYVLALIDHMDEVHPVDRSRVYLSGFSMGSMFSNALAAAHPGAFAGVVALNGPNLGYLETLDQSAPAMMGLGRGGAISSLAPSGEAVSHTHALADAAWEGGRPRMPFVQFVGELDGVGLGPGRSWPLTGEGDGMWPATIGFWMARNAVGAPLRHDPSRATGLAADETTLEGGRYWHQLWHSADEGSPAYYHLVMAERMPHAVDPAELRLGWDVVRRWARDGDGSLRRVD